MKRTIATIVGVILVLVTITVLTFADTNPVPEDSSIAIPVK